VIRFEHQCCTTRFLCPQCQFDDNNTSLLNWLQSDQSQKRFCSSMRPSAICDISREVEWRKITVQQVLCSPQFARSVRAICPASDLVHVAQNKMSISLYQAVISSSTLLQKIQIALVAGVGERPRLAVAFAFHQSLPVQPFFFVCGRSPPCFSVRARQLNCRCLIASAESIPTLRLDNATPFNRPTGWFLPLG